MKIKSFTHPHVVPNLYDFLTSVEHKNIYIFLVVGSQTIEIKNTEAFLFFLIWLSLNGFFFESKLSH